MISESWEYYKEVYKDMMSLGQYQSAAAKTAMYKHNHKVLYPALGLAGEAGEVANKVKKMLRDDNLDKNAIASEIGDVLWYAAMLSKDLNIELHDVAMKNLEKLYDRKERGTIQGDGDER
jgi:NTP pyrophosphatase (non-canonical NTP hydrolase)|tara:strand:+ start:1145 stop:1504 length:360 start_codon:yes stop_codon:yes gene_type:complete